LSRHAARDRVDAEAHLLAGLPQFIDQFGDDVLRLGDG